MKIKSCKICKAEKGAIVPYYSHQIQTEDFKTKTTVEFICNPCDKDLRNRIKNTIQSVLPMALRENMRHQIYSKVI